MYDTHNFKVPQQSGDYAECSAFVIQEIKAIITAAMDSGQNKILIATNLKLGLPMENINKIAGPFIEARAYEVFSKAVEDEKYVRSPKCRSRKASESYSSNTVFMAQEKRRSK